MDTALKRPNDKDLENIVLDWARHGWVDAKDICTVIPALKLYVVEQPTRETKVVIPITQKGEQGFRVEDQHNWRG